MQASDSIAGNSWDIILIGLALLILLTYLGCKSIQPVIAAKFVCQMQFISVPSITNSHGFA